MSLISTYNKTTVSLDDGESFVGIPENVSNYEGVFVNVASDQDCTVTLAWSNDNTNFRFTEVINVLADTPFEGHYAHRGIHFRVTVLNESGSNMTYLDVFCKFTKSIGGYETGSEGASEATLSAVNGKLASLGQKDKAGSMPVTLASDEDAISVTGTITADLNSIGDVATQTTLSTMNDKLAFLGQKDKAGSMPVTLASDEDALSVTLSTTNVGTYGNLSNNTTLNLATTTTAVDVSNISTGFLYYEDTSTASYDSIEIEVSTDNMNWMLHSTTFPSNNTAGTKRTTSFYNMGLHGVSYLRLKNTSATDNYTNVYATIVGSP